MGSVFTNAGQTRINQLAGLEQTLVIDRMVFANIDGLDPAAAIDRTQGMPDAGDIVHTATIDPANKGYVNPDQVVFSVILGSDLGNWSFNWIGLIEAVSDTVIAITTLPLTPKTKTDVGSNTTGDCITRNFMLQFADAQNLTAINVAAETWQFNWQAEWNNHEQQLVDPSQDGATGKHVTDTQAKKWEEHADDPHNYVLPGRKINTSPPLKGGGALDADRTLSIDSATESAAGVVEYATSAEAVTGTSTSRAVHPAGLKAAIDLANTTSKNTNGYIKLNGGLIIQWGTCTNASNQTITFPIAFPSACRSVVVTDTVSSSSANTDYTATTYDISQTQFSIRNSVGSGNNRSGGLWMAIGY